MTDHSRWKIEFVLHEELGIVEALFGGVSLIRAEDVEEWDRRVRAGLSRFEGQVDLLIGLDGLRVKPAAARLFGEARAAVLQEFASRSFRYGADLWTATSISTSAVLDGADHNLFTTREEALEALLNSREAMRRR